MTTVHHSSPLIATEAATTSNIIVENSNSTHIENPKFSEYHHSVSINDVTQLDPTSNNDNKVDLQSHDDSFVESAIQEEDNCIASESVSSFLSDPTKKNVTSSANGAKVLFATDEWFACADNLLKDTPPTFDPDAYCQEGKVMDGWETRRRREAGHDWCIIKLSERISLMTKDGDNDGIGVVEIDTAFFTGNHVPSISLQVADLTDTEEISMVSQLPKGLERLLRNGAGIQGTGMTPIQVQDAQDTCESIEWKTVLEQTKLQPGYEASRYHLFPLQIKSLDLKGATHLRVNYFPDGGVARLRLWARSGSEIESRPSSLYYPLPVGDGPRCTMVPHLSSSPLPSQQSYNLTEVSSLEHGGLGLLCSNQHYGEPVNLIQSNYGRDMGDGWETARHPNRPSVWLKNTDTGLLQSHLKDWCVLKLGSVVPAGELSRIILDTKHFRGNYPESVLVEGCFVESDDLIMAMANEEEEESEPNSHSGKSSRSNSITSDSSSSNNNSIKWFPLVTRCRMAPDAEHMFEADKHQILNTDKKVSHIKVSIYPDGGVSRVRVYSKSGELQ